jgi:hypothetical protein
VKDLDHGGGASRSTDPAAGSSAATDVSLREYVMAAVANLDRQMTSELAALRRETEAAQGNAKEAVGIATVEAKERLSAHNGLIDRMEVLTASFVTREILETLKESYEQRLRRTESWQSKITGGLILMSVIGVANLVKIWV